MGTFQKEKRYMSLPKINCYKSQDTILFVCSIVTLYFMTNILKLIIDFNDGDLSEHLQRMDKS